MLRCFVLAVASALALAVPAGAQEAEPTGKPFGELAAYARRCGYYNDAAWLQAEFGDLKGFDQARRSTSLALESYDIVHLKCGRVRDAVESVKALLEAEQE